MTKEMALIIKHNKINTLKQMIADAYYRMATNTDEEYHIQQMEKVYLWHEEMMEICSHKLS